MTNKLPQLESYLPELVNFIDTLVQDYGIGKFDSWQKFGNDVKAFFIPPMMQRIETVIPGWHRMAEFANGVTLVHVAAAMVALYLAPEYRQAAPAQKAVFQWIVLFHDVAKEIHAAERDNIHGFRSAVIAAKALPKLGFSVTDDYADQVETWADLTNAAVIQDLEKGVLIQDNQKLPEILAGIDRLFGRNTTPALIVKTVLLHLSVNAIREWPQAAPLSEMEIKRYIDIELLPYIKLMMFIDNDAWELFNHKAREKQRREILFAFRAIEKKPNSKGGM